MKRTIRLLAVTVLMVSVFALPFYIPHQANAAIADWQKGVSMSPRFAHDFGSPSFNQSVSNAKSAGANYITLIIPYYQSNVGSTDIGPGWNTPTDEDLTAAISYIHGQGLHVVLKPHLDSYDGQWRAHINPGDRDTWFKNYGAVLTHLATLAAANSVEGICIGTELINMSTDTSNGTNAGHWKDLISSVRSIYSGFLTYSANWGGGNFEDEKSHISFWSQLDYIGMSAYFNLNSSNNVSDLQSAWTGYDQGQIKPLSDKYGKPVLFTEIGYRSVTNAHYSPWNSTMGGGYDPTEQANDYTALFNYWNNRSYLAGIYLWEWNTNPQAGGSGDTGYTPQNKPAQDVMTSLWGGSGSPATTTPPVATTTPPVATTTPPVATTTPPIATTTPPTDTGTSTATTTDTTATTTATTTPQPSPSPTPVISGGGGGYATPGPSFYLRPVLPTIAGLVLGTSTENISSSTQSASTTPGIFTRNLRMGMRGADVKYLQHYLISQGYLFRKGNTGYFGVLTQRALMKYQRAMSISATGFFGPMTRNSIK